MMDENFIKYIIAPIKHIEIPGKKVKAKIFPDIAQYIILISK